MSIGRQPRVRGWFALSVVSIGVGAGCRSSTRVDATDAAITASSGVVAAAKGSASALRDEHLGEHADAPLHTRRPPSGDAPRLSCAAARALIEDIHARLAADPRMPTTADVEARKQLMTALSDGIIDWADPHGLWTAPPDSPVAAKIRDRAGAIVDVLEGRADCDATLRPIGDAMVHWVADLRREMRAGEQQGSHRGASTPEGGVVDPESVPDVFSLVGRGAFEDGAVTKPGKALARELGVDTAALLENGGRPDVISALAESVRVARVRWLPEMDAGAWSEIVLAAAVRSYVPLLDPHGAWAPSEESSALFDRDLEMAPPPRLWAASTRTAVGVHVDGGAMAPIAEGDVILAVDDVVLAGLSAEAIDQLAEAPEADDASTPSPAAATRDVRLLRGDRLISVHVSAALSEAPVVGESLATTTVRYGDGDVLVVRVTDVPDGLGDDVARTVAEASRSESGVADRHRFVGLVLDLRGNGGGSIDGASGLLGLFLPGAPLFPLKHRDGAIETERAAEPPLEDRWSGPLAVLVDGGTASAAEMIAGALHAYRRAVIVGNATYGKGCAQEYLDDAVNAGVLRLTTLLFALPDGAPVQRIGVRPDIALPFPSGGVTDHEGDLPRAAPSWSGPDVRDGKRIVEVPWPTTTHVGPCRDAMVCKSLDAVAMVASKASGVAHR